jgi:hypothetical protein
VSCVDLWEKGAAGIAAAGARPVRAPERHTGTAARDAGPGISRLLSLPRRISSIR